MSTVEFGSLFRFIRNGMNVKQNKSGEGLPITRIETISVATVDPIRVGYAGLSEDDCRDWLLKPGDILFSHINSVEHIGKCAVYRGEPEKLVHGMNLLCLRSDQERLLPEFAKYLIRNSAFRLRLANFIKKAVNQASVSIGHLKSIRVVVPPLSEQRRIAEILDKADALRAKRRAALAELDILTQSIFLDMFGDPATNPKGMRKKPLGDLIKLKSGDFLPATEMAEFGVHAVLGGNGISGFHNRYMFEDRQIVIGRVGVYCGCVHVSPPNSWVTDNALYVSEYSDDLVFDYLVHALIHAQLNRYASQFGQPLVSGSRIYPVQVLVPPRNLQHFFVERIRKAGSLKDSHESSRGELEALFASLQHRAFRGEL